MTMVDDRPTVQLTKATVQPKVWWLSPVYISLLVAAMSILSAGLVGDRQFRTLWRTPKWITQETLLLFGCGALALAFGALAVMAVVPTARRSSSPRWPGLSQPSLELLRRASTVFTVLTIVGYAGFAYLFLRTGIDPLSLASAYASGVSVRDVMGTIPGLTTLTQFGVPAVVVSALLLAHRYSRAELGKLLIIGGLAVVRAYLFSERLAILELVVPVVAVFAGWLAIRPGWPRKVLRLMPVAFVLGVVMIFGVFEYFRSWTYYRSHGAHSYTEFVLSRIAGYYATALNNGELMLDHLRWPSRLPYHTIEAIWVAPGVDSFGLYERIGGHPPPIEEGDPRSLYDVMLAQYANPEFNNQSGYGSVFGDYGAIGGLVVFLVIGVIAGVLYRGFTSGTFFGLCLYPVFFVGLLELPRYIYWSQGRTMYAWIGLVAVAVLLSRREAKERHVR